MIASRLPLGGPKHFESSVKLCEYIAQHTDTVLLGFSAGKDALSAWLQARRYFKVVPFYLYYVPGIRFVEENLDYYENFFQTKIHRYPSPDFFRIVNNYLYQTPATAELMREAMLPRGLQVEHVVADLMKQHSCKGTVLAEGVKITDSLARAMAIKQHGSLYRHRAKALVVYDWTNDTMERNFKSEGVQLASDYNAFIRTWEGATFAQMAPMKRLFPKDYERMLRWMPLAEAEFARRKFYEQEGLAATAIDRRALLKTT